MPNFKTGLPRQTDYDDDFRSLLLRMIRVEQGVSAALRASTPGTITAAPIAPTPAPTPPSGGGGGATTGFISLSLPSYLTAGAAVQVPPGGALAITDGGSGVTAGTYTAPIVTFDQFGRATFATASGIGGGGVTSLNNLTGALTLVAGAGIGISSAGTSITITASTTAAAVTNYSAGYWNIFGPLTPPNTADTFWVNQQPGGGTGATLSVLTALEVAHQTAAVFLQAFPDATITTAPGNLRMRLMAKPTASTWTATIAFQPLWRNAAFPEMGIMLANTAATVGNVFEGFHLIQNAGALSLEVVNYTAGLTGAAVFGAPTVPFSETYPLRSALVWMRVRQTTGVLAFESSNENRIWQWLAGWATGTYITSLQQIGYFVNARNNALSAGMVLWHWRVDQQ